MYSSEHQYMGMPQDELVPEMSLAEVVANGMNPQGPAVETVPGFRFPDSPGQMEGVYMDMSNLNLPPPEPSPSYSTTGPCYQWGDEEDFKIKQESQSDDCSEYGSVTADEPPPKPRRGRLPMNDERLTPYERQKKERRREQNRRAARKCREKRKQHQDVIVNDYYRLKEENERLKEENAKISAERDRLSNVLRSHQNTCTLGPASQLQLPGTGVNHQQFRHPGVSGGPTSARPISICPSTTSTMTGVAHHQHPSPPPPASSPGDQAITDEIANFVFESIPPTAY